jgi:MerR family copper efflux transcriptional regulator
VRRGLLTPETNGKGGRNPYQVFTAEHVRAAKFICTAQSLGLSLKVAAIGCQSACKFDPIRGSILQAE